MSFVAGQTVWRIREKSQWSVVHVSDGNVWIEQRGEHGVRHGMIELASELSTTDPNQPAEPVPEACPWCQVKPHIAETMRRGLPWVVVICDDEDGCGFRAIGKPTRLEAIQAWNSIRVEPHGRPMTKDQIADLVQSTLDDFTEPTPKPCPCCTRQSPVVNDSGRMVFQVDCECGTSGAATVGRKNAIFAWNKLGDVAAEREECANALNGEPPGCDSYQLGWKDCLQLFKARIRSRGQQVTT